MIQIGGRPVLWHIMKLYAHYGITDFVLCLGYKGWLIKEFFLNYPAIVSDIRLTLGRQTRVEYLDAIPEQNWCITLADTGEHAQTGSRIRQVRKYLEDS